MNCPWPLFLANTLTDAGRRFGELPGSASLDYPGTWYAYRASWPLRQALLHDERALALYAER
jgi:hypothetical protein